MIDVGMEYRNQTFTDMRYLTNDPQGMTYIAICLENLRQMFNASNNCKNMVSHKAFSKSHGIEFVG